MPRPVAILASPSRSVAPQPRASYTGATVTFRDKLIGTLRLLQPILEEPGVLVIGSEVPNLLQPDAASTLVVSQDVDLGVPVDRVQTTKIDGLVPSADEPSGSRTHVNSVALEKMRARARDVRTRARSR